MANYSISGLNHLGLIVEDIEIAKKWFIDTLGFQVMEDRGELVFLMIGNDILAIKTPRMAVAKPEHGGESTSQEKGGWQTMDHYGFYAESPEQVDDFAAMLETNGIEILKGPYSRRDGRSVYFRDPCNNVGEYLYFNPEFENQK